MHRPMLTVSYVSFALCTVVEIRFLALCEYRRRFTSRYRGHKIKTTWYFTFLLKCPTGRLLSTLACECYRKTIFRSVLVFWSTDSLNFLFSLGIGCLPYNVSATVQTAIDKVHFFVSKLNTPWALMALWINYDPKTSTFYSFSKTLSTIKRF